MQHGFLDEGASLEVVAGREIIPTIRGLVDAFRAKEAPVIFTEFVYADNVPCLRGDPFGVEHLPAKKGEPTGLEHPSSNCLIGPNAGEGVESAETVEELAPLRGELVIQGHTYDKFYGTPLDLSLRSQGITHLVDHGHHDRRLRERNRHIGNHPRLPRDPRNRRRGFPLPRPSRSRPQAARPQVRPPQDERGTDPGVGLLLKTPLLVQALFLRIASGLSLFLLACGKPSEPIQEASDEVNLTSEPNLVPVPEPKQAVTVLWEFETGGWNGWMHSSSPAIGSDGTVYVGSGDNKLYAINGKSGAKLWEFETGSFVLSSPAIGSDGTVYVGSYDTKLYAINGKSGVKKWECETGGGVTSSPAIGSDGTVYVGMGQQALCHQWQDRGQAMGI